MRPSRDQLTLRGVPQRVVRLAPLELLERVHVLAPIVGVRARVSLRAQAGSDSYRS